MFYIHPLYIFIIAIFSFIIVFSQMYFKGRFSKKYLLIFFVNTLFSGTVWGFYETVLKDLDWFNNLFIYYAIFNFTLFFIALLINLRGSFNAHNFYGLLTKSVKKTKWSLYLMLDAKDRIKDISENFLNEFGLEFKKVKNKNFFDIIEKCIRIKTYNGVEINNKELRKHYKNYKKEAINKSEGERRELVFLNFEGSQVIAILQETPFFSLSKYKGRILIGEKKNDFSMLDTEKKLRDLTEEHNSLISRFQAMIDLTEEGVCFIDMKENYVWGNNTFKDLLKIDHNALGISDLLHKIHPDHESIFMNKIRNLSQIDPKSNFTIQIARKEEYFIAALKLHRLFTNEDSVIICTINDVSVNNFTKSGMQELDSLKCESELAADLHKVIQSKRPFYYIMLKIVSVKEINERHSWAIGNYFLNEYVKQLKKNFVSESSSLYRLSGVDFALTITDLQKMELFKKLIQSGHTLDKTVEMGNISETVRVKMGILTERDASKAEEFIKNGTQALKFACSPNYNKYYYYYDSRH